MKRQGFVQGLLGGVLVAGVAWLLPATLQFPFLAGLLWLTVGIYLGMALMDGTRATKLQFLGGVPVMVLAMLTTVSPWFLVAGWVVHPLWDLLHDPGPLRTKIHPNTVPFCIVFDVIVAALAAALALMA